MKNITTEKYQIFGQIIQINYNNKIIDNILKRELSIYPKACYNEKSELIIETQFPDKVKPICVNPKTHIETNNGFITNFGNFKVLWKFIDNKLHSIYLSINQKKSFINIINKFRSMDFLSYEESIGMFFHEIILVPSTFFSSHTFPIHASGFQASNSNKSILIGGTGGVGKTSLELEFCLNKKFNFITDDIAILSKNKTVFPNLSFPKIYAYNTEKNPVLLKQIFKNKNLSNCFHWHFFKKIKGLNKVRRRINPKELYNLTSKNPSFLENYFILFRTNCSKIEVENISTETAVELSLNIMKTEYNAIFKHFIWHEYNSLSMKKNPYITMSSLIQKWKNLATITFEGIKIKLIKIPIELPHYTFKTEMVEIIKNII